MEISLWCPDTGGCNNHCAQMKRKSRLRLFPDNFLRDLIHVPCGSPSEGFSGDSQTNAATTYCQFSNVFVAQARNPTLNDQHIIYLSSPPQ